MIPITYFRSSSLNTLNACEHQYFLEYVLGLPTKSNQKADMGTMAHKVLEIVAILKKEFQDKKTQSVSIEDDCIGNVTVDWSDFIKTSKLSDEDVDKINKTRKNKDVYKDQDTVYLPYGHKRMGREFIRDILVRTYDYYLDKFSTHKWQNAHKNHVINWVWMALDYRNGEFDPRNKFIVQPEQQFQLEIEDDWASYFYDLPEGTLIGNLKLKGTIDLIFKDSEDDDVYEICDWKGLPLDTDIPTLDGWTTMGEVKEGDILFDRMGRQTKVIGKSTVKFLDCFEITFDDTSKCQCDEEHLWKTSDGRTVPITELKIGDKIDVSKPIQTEEKELPIDPYVLGIWLGDGRNRNSEISGADDFIFEEIERRGYKVGKDISGREGLCRTSTIFELKKELRKLNLLHNKHIPDIYKRASFEQRLELLRGLLDSDGNVNSVRKQAVFTNCNKRLSDDFKELALSLGQRPYQSHVKSTGFGVTVDNYPVQFKPIDINPFLIPRKADKVLTSWGHGKSKQRKIVKIEKIPKRATQCIKVDSDDSTFLCTRNFIPTHNTGQRKCWVTNERKTVSKLQSDIQLLFYNYAIRHLYPDIENMMINIFFIRDGGPSSLVFDEKDVGKMHDILKQKMHSLLKQTKPNLLHERRKASFCRFCDFNKPDENGVTDCERFSKRIKKYGIEHVIKKDMQDGHSIDIYNAPGG